MVLHLPDPVADIARTHEQVCASLRTGHSSMHTCVLTEGQHAELGMGPSELAGLLLESEGKRHEKLVAVLASQLRLTLQEAECHWPPLVVDLSNSLEWTVVKPDGLCPTLTAGHGCKSLYLVHQDYRRFMSPFEHVRVMGFAWPQLKAASQTLRLSEVGRLAGNAVTAKSAECMLSTLTQAFPQIFLTARRT